MTESYRNEPATQGATPGGGRSFGYGGWLALGFAPVSLAVYFCMKQLDGTVSMLVARYLYGNETWSRYTSSIPDLLLTTVLITTAAAYSLFRYRASRGHIDSVTLACKLLAYTAPLSFLAKTILKIVFGRTSTREWLIAPQPHDFHWFQGGGSYSGFPSGHMAVFTAILAVIWRLLPRYRGGCMAFLLLMGLALIMTNYHFVSDVIAGTYLGLLVELFVWRIVTMRESRTGKELKP